MTSRRISMLDLAALSAPTFLFAGFELAHRVLLPAFLTGHIGLQVGLAGLIIVAMRGAAIVAGGVFGALADLQISRRVGRRRTWTLLGTPLALVATFAAFTASPGTGAFDMSLRLALMMLGWTMINAVHGAWALESASGIADRSRVFAARSMAGITGFLAFSLLVAEAGSNSERQLSQVFLVLLIGVPLTTAALISRLPDPPHDPVRFRIADFLAPLTLWFSSRSRTKLTLLFALVGAHAAISSGSFVYMVSIGLSLPDSVGPALVVQACAGLVGLPAGVWLSRRLGVNRTLGLVFVVDIVVAAGLYWLPVGSANALLAWTIVRGLFWGLDFTLLRALAGEELDLEQAAPGASRAGVFYASFHLAYNCANMLATGVLFAVYSATGFEPGAAHMRADPRIAILVPALLGMIIAGALCCVLARMPRSHPTAA